MSVESFTSRAPLILAAFRQHGGHLSVAELAVPEVGGSYWRAELHAMRKNGYVLIEDGDLWFLENDAHVPAAPVPDGFDFRTALRAMTERGRLLDARQSGTAAGEDPRIAAACQLPNGHELAVGPSRIGNVCVHCGEAWSDALLTRACVRARAAA